MKILFGVFEWGIGHATRDIPLINALLKRGHEVHIIVTGRSLDILKNHFKNKCKYFDVVSLHDIYYNINTKFIKANFIFSIPKIIKTLKKARQESEKIIKKGNYDIVISDCRLDVYDKINNSYLINHQLRYKSPFGTERIIEKSFSVLMKHYKYFLVPDFKNNNLSGRLSHDLRYFDKKKIKYIGIISNLRQKNSKKDIDYFISFSGPEPARTLLEKKILENIKELKGKVVIAAGNPKGKIISPSGVEFYNFVSPKNQENFMNRAKFLIVRAGYTTIMEIAELNKKALLIPTPGHPEQMYLGKYLKDKGYFYSVSQKKLDLKKDIEIATKFKGYKAPWNTSESIKKFIKLVGA